MSEWEDEGFAIDWENPFDAIRSSEVEDIKLEMLDNGRKLTKQDQDGEDYTQYKFKCKRVDIKTPAEITYITSSKRLIEEIQFVAPIEGKTLQITKSGTGFQTQYKVKEVKK